MTPALARSPYRPPVEARPRLGMRSPPTPPKQIGGGKLGLTRRQLECLDFIVRYIEANSVSPSFEEMAESLHVGKSNVARLVKGLTERGHITYEPNRARSISLIEAGRHTCPNCGHEFT